MKLYNIIRLTSIRLTWILATISSLLCLLMEKDLIEAHIDGAAYWFSSDGPQYYRMYLSYIELNYFDSDFIRFSNPLLYVLIGVGLPSLTLWCTNGGMWLTNLFNVLFLFWGLLALLKCLPGYSNTVGYIRWKFLGYFMFFPYVLPGIVSINKEVFCLASALFFSAYFLDGDENIYFSLCFLRSKQVFFGCCISSGGCWYLVPRMINRRWFKGSLAFVH